MILINNLREFDPMTTEEYNKADKDAIWDYCMCEYNNQNPIAKKLFDNFYKELENIIPKNESAKSFLEIGCGPAESSKRILKMLPQNSTFEASEFDERYVQKIQELKIPIKVIQESVYELKREDNSFDCLFLLEVLEHLEDKTKAISELFRVSSKYVVISVPNEPIWSIMNMMRFKYLADFGNTPGHINRFNLNKLTKLVEPYGKLIDYKKPLPWLMCVFEKK